MLERIAKNPLNYKLLVQKGIQDELLSILTQTANFCRSNLFELRAQLYKVKNLEFEDYPKGKNLRLSLAKLKQNLQSRFNFSKLFILANRLTILIMPPTKKDVFSYMQREIDEVLSERSWGGLIKELYGSLEGFTDNNPQTEYTSEAPDYTSSCSEHSRVEDAESGLYLGGSSKPKNERHYLETSFGSEMGSKLREWYVRLVSQNEDLVTLSDAIKQVEVDQFRSAELKNVEISETGILEGWTLHVDGVVQEINWQNYSDDSD